MWGQGYPQIVTMPAQQSNPLQDFLNFEEALDRIIERRSGKKKPEEKKTDPDVIIFKPKKWTTGEVWMLLFALMPIGGSLEYLAMEWIWNFARNAFH